MDINNLNLPGLIMVHNSETSPLPALVIIMEFVYPPAPDSPLLPLSIHS